MFKLTEFRDRLHPGAFLWIVPFLLVFIHKGITNVTLYQDEKTIVFATLQILSFGILNFLNWVHSKTNKQALVFSILISCSYFFSKTEELTLYEIIPFTIVIWILLANLYMPRESRLIIVICLFAALLIFPFVLPQQRSQDVQFFSIIGIVIISLITMNCLLKPSSNFRRISIFLGINGIVCLSAGALTSLAQYFTIGLALIFTAISTK